MRGLPSNFHLDVLIIPSPAKALQLFNAGCRSIADMRKPEYHSSLTSAQQIGLRFIDQIPKPITREQAETILVNNHTFHD